MTEKEALDECRRRFGPRGNGEVRTNAETGARTFSVGRVLTLPGVGGIFEVLGSGESWEAAFVASDERERRFKEAVERRRQEDALKEKLGIPAFADTRSWNLKVPRGGRYCLGYQGPLLKDGRKRWRAFLQRRLGARSWTRERFFARRKKAIEWVDKHYWRLRSRGRKADASAALQQQAAVS